MSFRLPAATLLLTTLAACGGGGGGGNNPPNDPPPTTGNPCSTASATGLAAPADERLRASKREMIDGDSRYHVLNSLALSRARAARGEAAATAAPQREAVDIGEIAVVQDEGDLIAPPTSYALRGAGVGVTRNGADGYDARRIAGNFRCSLGRQL